MFRIGEFSQIARVTIETLRYYDALGLLKPARVDPLTSYRYYTASQLETLNRIRALKESGFSLEEIARILSERLTGEELRGMLKAQLQLAEREIEAVQARREQIINRLNYLEEEETMPDYEVTLKPVEALSLAAIRESVPAVEQMPARCSQMFQTIAEWMAANRLPFGPSLVIYHCDEYRLEDIDTECAFVIPGAAALPDPAAPVLVRTLEAQPCVAYTLASGDFYGKVDGLTPAYQAIAHWIEENGYRITGPAREFFYGSPQSGDFTAEIQFPVEKG